jgi:hypothetical protein
VSRPILPSVTRFDKALVLAAAVHGCAFLVCSLTPRPSASGGKQWSSHQLEVELLIPEETVARLDVAIDSPIGVASLDQRRGNALGGPSAPNAPLATDRPNDVKKGHSGRDDILRVQSSPGDVVKAPTEPSDIGQTASAPPVAALGAGAAAPGTSRGPNGAVTTAGTPGPSTTIDLGLQSRSLALPAQQALVRREKRQSDIQNVLRAEIAKDDVDRGLARGGVLVDSMRGSVQTAGPARGTAVIAVFVDEHGEARDVELVSGNDAEWGEVLRLFRSKARAKRVSLPPGARGMRLTMSVSARVQRVSGADAKGSAVALDTIPLSGSFDVADLSGVVRRQSYVRILSEQVL